MPIAGPFPAVARDLVGATNPASGEDDRLGAKDFEATALAIVTESAHHPPAILQQAQNGVLHEDFDPLVHPIILEGADHFQTGPITDMGETGIFMAAEIALQNPPIFG